MILLIDVCQNYKGRNMIVVTGGAGFLGSNLIAGLEDIGVGDIVLCDCFGDGDKWKNTAKREIRDLVAPDDLFDYLQRHADKVDMVFHIGAMAYTTAEDTDLVIKTNFTLSRELWKWCAANDTRFLYVSSYSTYGAGSSLEDFSDDDTPEALSKLRPLNPYGWSKHLFDRRVARIVSCGREDVPPQWVGLKVFNAYGPNEYHKDQDQSIISQMYPSAAVEGTAKLFRSLNPDYSDGCQLRDFVWVQDVVDVMIWFYKHKDKNGLYNVGSGEARTFKDVAHALFSACDKSPKITYIDMPQGLWDKYQYYTQADISKLRSVGYDKPMTSLEDGVRQFVRDYLMQDDPYR